MTNATRVRRAERKSEAGELRNGFVAMCGGSIARDVLKVKQGQKAFAEAQKALVKTQNASEIAQKALVDDGTHCTATDFLINRDIAKSPFSTLN